ISVGIYNAQNQQLSQGTTNDAGIFITQAGVKTGLSYYAKTFVSSTTTAVYVNQIYNVGKGGVLNCVGFCQPSSGAPIAVNGDTPNINFTLVQGGTVTGTVTDSNNAGVQGITVNVYTKDADPSNNQQTLAGSGFSGPGGGYSVGGLPDINGSQFV